MKTYDLGREAINRSYRINEGATVTFSKGGCVNLMIRYMTKEKKPFVGLQITDAEGFEEYQHLRFPMQGFAEVYKGIEARLAQNPSNRQIVFSMRSVNGLAKLRDNYR